MRETKIFNNKAKEKGGGLYALELSEFNLISISFEKNSCLL